jgi:hypothetical protein
MEQLVNPPVDDNPPEIDADVERLAEEFDLSDLEELEQATWLGRVRVGQSW